MNLLLSSSDEDDDVQFPIHNDDYLDDSSYKSAKVQHDNRKVDNVQTMKIAAMTINRVETQNLDSDGTDDLILTRHQAASMNVKPHSSDGNSAKDNGSDGKKSKLASINTKAKKARRGESTEESMASVMKSKIALEERRFDYQITIDKARVQVEEGRLALDVKRSELDIKGEIRKQRFEIMKQNIEIMNMRKQATDINPSLTQDDLDSLFPLNNFQD